MKTILLIEQVDNRSVGIFQENDGTFLALTLTQSAPFKTEKGARKWLARKGYAA